VSKLTYLVRFQPMHDFTLLILPGAFPSSVAMSLDVLAAATAMAPRIGAPTPRWRVYVPAGTNADLGHGLSIKAKQLPRSVRSDDSIWVVPGLGLESTAAIRKRLSQPDAKRTIEVLRLKAHSGNVVAASCSAVFLLQAADLLIDKKVTTSWWLAPQLQRMEPRCVVDANRMVISDGLVVTAGAALAQTDLMLHLLRARFGTRLADAVSLVLLIDQRQSQAPFVVPAMLATGNKLIAELTERVDAALPNPPSVAALAREFCVSQRTLARHVRAATGRSPVALVQSVRINKARALLESSRLTVEQIAERVGYSDSTALRRLMRKTFGATPQQLRRSIAVG
jgi:transcriptional regulator GlxA family with amidase domain